MMMPAVRWSPGLGSTVKLGSSDKRDVHPEGRAFARPVGACGARRSASTAPLGTSRSNSSLGLTPATTPCARHALPPATTPAARPLLDDHLLDRRVEHDSTPASRPLGHRLGDRAHAADRMAPGARDPGRLAEHMVEQDVGGARRVGASKIADDAVEAEQGLGEIALEIAVEDVGRRCAWRNRGRCGLGELSPTSRGRAAAARAVARRPRRHWAARAAAIS